MRRRMGRPGLVGTMARTAVIASTATAVSGSVRQKQMASQQNAAAEQQAIADQAQQAAESQAQMAAMQAQIAALTPQDRPAPAAPASGGGDLLAQLEKLGNLKAAGLLTDDEFAAAKGRLLTA